MIIFVIFLFFLIPTGSAFADDGDWVDSRFRVELEAGAAWQASNDVQVPNNDTATRFSLKDLGNGAYPAFRLGADWNINNRHGLRIVLAPFEFTDSGTFTEEVRFQGETYEAGQAVKSTYRFSTYRLTYRYHLFSRETWSMRVGATALIRDAKIKLEQDGTSSQKTNTGIVPLLHLDARYKFNENWQAVFDSDFLGSSQGRAFDIALVLRYAIDENWDVSAGYRMVEGGADNDDVYNFAWFHQAILQVGYNFSG